MKIYAPGKLILSGEHAVVHGAPALAMAINRYAIATISTEQKPHIAFDLKDLAHHSRLSIEGLRKLKSKVKRKYQRFIHGEYSIRQVLQKPFELAQLAMGVFADSANVSLPNGVKVHVDSEIPIGCGMGSSAATILCVMTALSRYLNSNISPEAMFRIALETENMQHGNSSGLDLRIAMQGGCIYYRQNEFQTRAVPEITMYLVNTGKPESTTGQCVEAVRGHFSSSQLIQEFAAVTNALDTALQAQIMPSSQAAVQANHQLLVGIGVVPQRVQQFIRNIELHGGAAKICGAGAVTGEHAGAVLVLTDDQQTLRSECEQFGYDCAPVACDTRGVHAN